MITGINFSPPLYFLFNFCLQCIFPTSIEQLRIQSLAFIIIGIILSFLITQKIFGTTIAFFATILVASQSNILLSQVQEARHYAMFFACGAWVLYMQYLSDGAVKKYKWLNFFSHICLCQVHYLGIVFSGLVGISYLISSKQRILIKRIPSPVFIAWIFSLPVYLHLLSQQSSHLGNWPKPNGLSNLICSYNESFLLLTIIIPILAFIISSNSKGETKTLPMQKTGCSRPIMITSLLWLSLPLVFWIISRVTPLNLFVDRYFIPKEVSMIFIVAYGYHLFCQKLSLKTTIAATIISTYGILIFINLINTKRSAFGLNKNTNYHHSLIIPESTLRLMKPFVLEDEPVYFPNAYKNRNDYLFLVKDEQKKRLYIQFSKRLNILKN